MTTLDERIEAARKLEGYTPGPWRVVIDDDCNPLTGRPGVFSSDELDCGIVHWDGFVQEYWRSARGDKEIHANARIIAAAPDTLALVLDLAAERERLLAALREIATITERKENKYPSDWQEQIEACRECQRYKDHPIQKGICDEHRKPIYAQQDHDRHETEILGYRAQQLACAALNQETPDAE